MEPPMGQDFDSMDEAQLLDEQLMQQILLQSLDSEPGTSADNATKATIDRNLRRISQALVNLKRRRPAGIPVISRLTNAHSPAPDHYHTGPGSTTLQGGTSPFLETTKATTMSSNGRGSWGTNSVGGSGSKKRSFDANLGHRSPPRPSKVHRPTPSPLSSAYTPPSRDDWTWSRLNSSSPAVIDLTEDNEDLVQKQHAEEERIHRNKQQIEDDAELARRLESGEVGSPSPVPGPSSRPAASDLMSSPHLSPYGTPRGTRVPKRHIKPEPSSSIYHDTNSPPGFQSAASSSYGNMGSYSPMPKVGADTDLSDGFSDTIRKSKHRMPGSFVDDTEDDLFGDRFLQDDVNTSSSYQGYGAGTGNSVPTPAAEIARQAALRRQQQQFLDPQQGLQSPFMSASQIWNDQLLERPGSLSNGSADPVGYDASTYVGYQWPRKKPLKDIIKRSSEYDYENGTDELGNSLDPRVREVMDGVNGASTQEEGIQQLLANIGPSPESLDGDEDADPQELLFPLYKHQRQALHWMTRMERDEHKKGGILADDMGLGKTISSLALIVSRRPEHLPGTLQVRAKTPPKTTLIIAPVALVDQWKREIETKLKPGKQLKVFKYHTVKSDWSHLRSHDVVISTYGTVASEMTRLDQYMKAEGVPKDDMNVSKKFPLLGPQSVWYRIIVDEAQCIKNAKTKGAKALHQLKAEYRWCLTGTPMMNNVSELSSLITFLRIKPYCAGDKFHRAFGCLSTHRAGGYQRNDAMRQLQVLLSAIMLRRTKTSQIDGKPIINLPPKIEEQVHVVFDPDEAAFYGDLERDSQVQFNRYLKGGAIGKKYTIILILLLRLRQACCHPYLHLTDLDYVGNNGVEEDDMIELAKAMAPVVVQRLKASDSFECPICYDIVENPLFILPCGHETCPECFTRLTDGPNQQGVQAGQENAKTLCPQCRGPVDAKKTITYDIFKKVHISDQTAAEEESDDVEYDTDSDYDSDLSDRGFKDDQSDVDDKGNLKDFINDNDGSDDDGDDSDSDDLNHSGVDEDVFKENQARKSRKARKKRSRTAPEDSDDDFKLEEVSTLVERYAKSNSKGRNKTTEAKKPEPKKPKPKKLRPKGKEKEVKIKPHMLRNLRKEAAKNKRAHKRYMHYLKSIWEPSAKVTKCKDLIAGIQSTGEKTIVFSQWTLLLDLLEIPLKYELGVKYRRYDGSMSAPMRVNAANDFTDLPDVKVILVSLKAGNAGLNLNAASQVIIMDPFWNPYIELQAVDRAHRIGQQRTVRVHRILIKDTVEDRILTLQEKKRELIENALDPEVAKSIGTLGRQELAYLFGSGGQI